MYINLYTIDYSCNAYEGAAAVRILGRVPKSGTCKHFSHLKEVRLFPTIQLLKPIEKKLTIVHTLHETEPSYTREHKLDLNGWHEHCLKTQ